MRMQNERQVPGSQDDRLGYNGVKECGMGQKSRKISRNPVLDYRKAEMCKRCEITSIYGIDDMYLDYQDKEKLVVLATCDCGSDVQISKPPQGVIDYLKGIV